MDIPLRVTMGQRLRERRLALGLTTTQLATITGTSQSTISKIELGEWSVSLDRLEPILDALGVSVTITANDIFSISDSHGNVLHVCQHYEDLYSYLFGDGVTYVLPNSKIRVTSEYVLQYLEEYPPGMSLQIEPVATNTTGTLFITRKRFSE